MLDALGFTCEARLRSLLGSIWRNIIAFRPRRNSQHKRCIYIYILYRNHFGAAAISPNFQKPLELVPEIVWITIESPQVAFDSDNDGKLIGQVHPWIGGRVAHVAGHHV